MDSDTNMADAMAHLQPGQVVSHFELVKLLGQGAMGVVFEARDTVLDRAVAIKFIYLNAPSLKRPGVLEAIKNRFKREARLMARVRHNAVVAIHEASFEGDEPFIVMEYLDGQPLDLRMSEPPPLNSLQIAEIGWQTAAALNAAWTEHQLIHRDLKPGNMMILGDGSVKILDLGLAKALSDDSTRHNLTVTGMIMGTPYYMSPEQHMGSKHVDHRTDIFALGTILYQLLCGELPSSGTNDFMLYQAKVAGPSDALRQVSGLPQNLVDLIYEMLSPDAGARVASYATILRELEVAIHSLRHGHAGPPLLGVSGIFSAPTIEGLDGTMIVPELRDEQIAHMETAPSILPGGASRPARPREPTRSSQTTTVPTSLPIAPPAPPAAPPEPPPRSPAAPASPSFESPTLVAQAIRPGVRLGDYTVGELIGIGGMGAVFRGTSQDGTAVAIKVLITSEDSGSRIQNVRSLMRTVSRLDHDAIVPVITLGEYHGTVYQVMDLFLGPEGDPVNLVGYCKDFGKDGLADPEEFAPIMQHLLDALSHAHDQGLCHGNLKPQNVLLSMIGKDTDYWQAELKITDFGTSQIVGEDQVLTKATRSVAVADISAGLTSDISAMVDTYSYMSPEQRRGSAATPQSDVYTMGMLMLRLLTGRRELQRRKKPSESRDGLSPLWDDIILTALKEDPADRHPTARHLAAAIDKLV